MASLQPAGGVFQERTIPPGSRLAGWSHLVQRFGLQAPVRNPSAVSAQHLAGSHRTERGWTVFDKRYWPGDNLGDQLNFALKHETIDLLLLNRLFSAAPASELKKYIRANSSGASPRRIWYLYEAMTGRTLDVPEARIPAAVNLLDEEEYFTGSPRLSRRHRVRDNLLGTPAFSPVVRRTALLQDFIQANLSANAHETVGRISRQLIARAASFLLLADSRASFEIEGEHPPRTRLERWGRAVAHAGMYPLTIDEILRLHRVLIEDMRFVRPGLRREGVFLGERDHTGDPLPEFVGARPEDLGSLMAGLIAAQERMRVDGIDPVLEAAATAFAFVYIHPFEDGNGRVHRCLIHHVLTERKFAPPGLVFPVSSVMLDRIDDYRALLQRHSHPLMRFIEWRPTVDRNVEVTNSTADMYRYFDCTEEVEFLYACVQRTVKEDLPREIDYLRRHDTALQQIMDLVEMPNRFAEDLVTNIRQNKGVLAKKRRKREFAKLTDGEVAEIEAIVRDVFEL